MNVNLREARDKVIVVGGGLAGLTSALFLAREGHRVTLFEQAKQIGGRARTQQVEGFHFNLGPHALYRAGSGVAVLQEAGLTLRGTVPQTKGVLQRGGETFAFPATPFSLLTHPLLNRRAKVELFKLLFRVWREETTRWQRRDLQGWLEQSVSDPELRALMLALFRLFTYANNPQQQSAASAIEQMKRALRANVLYLDGGWQTLVDELQAVAEQEGVSFHPISRVVALEGEREVRGVYLADGTFHGADAIVLAVSPHIANQLLRGGVATVRQWAMDATPITVASLDLALSRLPNPDTTFALGIDEPLYFSVHSEAARLTPEGGALIHVSKYLPTERAMAGDTVRQQLEALVDSVQPGWREVVVHQRFLPRLTVSNALVKAEQGGLPGRPAPAIPEVANLFLAGDWVGAEGLLADASLASAKAAAMACAAWLEARDRVQRHAA